MVKHTFNLTPFDPSRIMILCGEQDQNLRYLEKTGQVRIFNHQGTFQIESDLEQAKKIEDTLRRLYDETEHMSHLDRHDVHLAWMSQDPSPKPPLTKKSQKPLHTSVTTPKRTIQARSSTQAQYLQAIEHGLIHFGIGPSGTGKTFLAVAKAIEALQNKQVHRIILARPAVEAGEKLGFLPGDLSQKVDPFLRPIYDAMHAMMRSEDIKHLMERHVIEIAPLAYLRGRTLSEAFIILDEAQNTTKEQLKMFITRMGMGSKMVINGDLHQVDLPKTQRSGLEHALKILAPIEDIEVTYFKAKDVVRHPLLEQVILAYEKDS